MKFIITESQFEKAVGSYLNYLLDEYEYHGNYYFAYKDSKLMQLKCNDFNNDNIIHVKMSSHIINDVKNMFSIDHDDAVNVISKWIENKTNKEVIGVTKTPYSQDLPLLVRK